MISQRTVDLAQVKIEVRPIANLQVKGKTKPVAVYELLARKGELNEKQKILQQTFTDAVAAFLKQEWSMAEKLLQEVLQLDPNDVLAKRYLKETRQYAIVPPGMDWNGVVKLDEK